MVSKLQFKRVKFDQEANIRLRTLKARTGITPNILCRVALCMSLEDPAVPDPKSYPEDSDREINRGVLFGDEEDLLTALTRQRLLEDE